MVFTKFAASGSRARQTWWNFCPTPICNFTLFFGEDTITHVVTKRYQAVEVSQECPAMHIESVALLCVSWRRSGKVPQHLMPAVLGRPRPPGQPWLGLVPPRSCRQRWHPPNLHGPSLTKGLFDNMQLRGHRDCCHDAARPAYQTAARLRTFRQIRCDCRQAPHRVVPLAKRYACIP